MMYRRLFSTLEEILNAPEILSDAHILEMRLENEIIYTDRGFILLVGLYLIPWLSSG